MYIKKCFKCGVGKDLSAFYAHKKMRDGHLNKCKDCTRRDAIGYARRIDMVCGVCGGHFKTCIAAINKGGGKYCSRGCYYDARKDEGSYNWKGEDASYIAKHKWVKRKLGSPNYCEHCKKTNKKVYHWANISGEYKRDVSDWKRLCVPCHSRYDRDKRDYLIIKCVICGENIKTKSGKRMFCSSSCSNKHYKNPKKQTI